MQLTGADVFTVREDCTINPAQRRMRLRGNNVTLFNSVHMYEECEYRQHPDNPNWTLKEQIAYLDIGILIDIQQGCLFLRSPHASVWELPKQDAHVIAHTDYPQEEIVRDLFWL